MDLKEYKEMPDEGMFERVQRHLARRRAIRIGTLSFAALALVGVLALLTLPNTKQDESTITAKQHDSPTVDVQTSQSNTVPAKHDESISLRASNEVMPSAKDTPTSVQSDRSLSAAGDVTSDDDLAQLAAMLPQGMPAIMPLNEAAAETYAQTDSDCPFQAVYIGLADERDTAAPVVQLPPDAKAGQPVPHFDNVIWAPNVIIPSGEVDDNRTFSIKATSPITEFKIHIYNRNGRRIYLATEPTFVWDGTMDGTPVPQGAYVWVATFRDSDGNPRQEHGTVTVIR